MKKALKIIIVIVMLILGMVTCTVVNIVRGVGDMAEEFVTPPEGQNIQSISPQGASLTAHLHPRYEVVLGGVQLCMDKTSVRASMISSNCAEGVCNTHLSFADTSIPEEITISRLVDGACVPQTIPNVRQYLMVAGYETTLVLDKAMLKQLDVAENANVTKAPESRFKDTQFVQINQNGRLWISYPERVASDVFLLGGKPLQVQYELAPVKPAMPAKLLQP